MATSSDGRPTFSDGEASGAALDGMRRVFRMELAAAPDATRPLSAGSYQIVASLQTPTWQFWGWRGRVESAPLVVTVVTTETADRQLAGTATFLYKTRQFDEAVRAARDWSARDAASIRARILLGDALLATGDRAGARDAYEAALDLANAASSNERPTAILERLDKLRAATSRRP
jgi:cytochrome c-type biogenesis protein CcmH/NrfG